MDLYQVFYRRKITTLYNAPKYIMWVKAVDEWDARRIVAENLDTTLFEITGAVYQPDEWRIQPKDFTIGFRRY